MADARAKAVLSELADLISQNSFVPQVASTSLRPPGFAGDVIEVPSISDLTVNTAGSTDANPESVTTNILTLTANLEPWINAKIPQMASMQLLNGGGNWARGVATHSLGQLMNNISSTYLTYLITDVIYDSSATYTINVGADTLTSVDILNAKATLMNQNGALEQNIVMVLGPWAEASIRSIATFVPNYTAAENGALGISRMGSVHGVPVYMSQSVPRLRSVATTAVSVTSNVATATVASGHGIVPGQMIRTAGHSTNATADVAVNSVTATTVVYNLTAGDGAMGDGVGTITVRATESIMLDKSHCFTSIQKMPGGRVVPLYNSTGDALQLSTIWGRVGRAGRAVSINSPHTSA